MNSIYEPATLKELTERLNKLTPFSQRLWGKMDVAQMMAHCSALIEMALGDKMTKAGFMEKLIGKFVKPMITNEKPFKQNMPTGSTFLIADSKDFDTEKSRLAILLKRFSTGGPEYMHRRKHSFFGSLTSKEWSNSTMKHLDHHFRQFGV